MSNTIVSDTFTRSNVASGWGTATDGNTWTQVRGVQALAVTSNEGTMTQQTNTNSGFMALSSGTAAQAETLVRFKVDSLTSIAGVGLRFVDSNNWYAAVIGNTSQTIEIRKDVAGTFSTVTGASASFTYSTNTFYWMRFRAVGTSLRAKIWADGSSEPSSWTISGTDSSISAAGRYGIVASPAATAKVCTFDHFSVNDATTQSDISSRFNLALLKDIASRLRLRSADQLKDVVTRFRLRSADRLKDISSRFVLISGGTQVLKDVASRFRLRSADQLKDVGTRFRLRSADQLKDVASRFRLRSADQTKDTSTRFRLSAQQIKDIASRLRLRSADQLRDIAARLRLMSANQIKDIASRLRLMSASQLKDVSARLRLRSADQARDIVVRFRQMSASQLRDIAARLRLRSADHLSDVRGRFILAGVVVPQVPGIATLSDSLHGAASIGDVLVDQATAGDVAVGVVTLSDQA